MGKKGKGVVVLMPVQYPSTSQPSISSRFMSHHAVFIGGSSMPAVDSRPPYLSGPQPFRGNRGAVE